MIPALIKRYHFPKTEIWSFYLLDVFAAFFNLLAVEKLTYEQVSYPVYIMLINIMMVFLSFDQKKLMYDLLFGKVFKNEADGRRGFWLSQILIK